LEDAGAADPAWICSLVVRSGAGNIADALAVYSDGQQAGLILWGRRDEIVSLEVYDCHPKASQRFPQISDLRIFEEPLRELQ